MSRTWVMIVVCFLAVCWPGSGEASPLLSGHWRVDDPKGALAFFCGQECTIMQTASVITFERNGRKTTYTFGAPVSEKADYGTTILTEAKWAGDVLTLTVTVKASDGKTVGTPGVTVASLKAGRLVVDDRRSLRGVTSRVGSSYHLVP